MIIRDQHLRWGWLWAIFNATTTALTSIACIPSGQLPRQQRDGEISDPLMVRIDTTAAMGTEGSIGAMTKNNGNHPDVVCRPGVHDNEFSSSTHSLMLRKWLLYN